MFISNAISHVASNMHYNVYHYIKVVFFPNTILLNWYDTIWYRNWTLCWLNSGVFSIFNNETVYVLSLGHTRSHDHWIVRLVTNLGDVRLVATTKDQSLGFIYDLPLMLFGKMHYMIGCDIIRTVMWPSSWIYNLNRKGEQRRYEPPCMWDITPVIHTLWK